LLWIAIHEQHARFAAEAGGGGGAIVLRDGIERGRDLHFVGDEIPVRLEIRSAEFVVAGFDRNVPLLDEELILVELHFSGRLHVAADVRDEVERLALFQTAGHIHFLHEDLGRGLRVEGHGEQLHALRREARGHFGGVAGGVIAIGDQDEAPGFSGGKDRAGKIERLTDVRGLAIGGRRPGLGDLEFLRGRLPKLGLGREPDDAGGVARLLVSQTGFHEIAGFLALGFGNARGIVHGEEHGEFAGWQQPSHAGQRQGQHYEDDQPQRETHPPLPARHVRQRSTLRPEEKQRDEREREEPGMRQLNHWGDGRMTR